MMHFVTSFWAEERGAVTVDWFVLTAGLVGLAVAAYVLAETGMVSVVTHIYAAMTSSGA